MFIFFFSVWVYLLDKLYLLAFDMMKTINFGEQSWVNAMIAEVAVKKNTSLLQGASYPRLKSFSRSKKLQMFRGKKPIAISLSKR